MVELAVHPSLRQAVLRDSVAQHAALLGLGLEDVALMASQLEVVGDAHAGRPGTDDGHPAAGRRVLRPRDRGGGVDLEDAIGAGAGACLLPPMLLQPLVENAVKHGIGNRLDGGTVRISAERAGTLLRIRVENDADEDDVIAPVAGCGIGLANVRQRLLATYAHEASVHWTRFDASFRVDIALPFETQPVMDN